MIGEPVPAGRCCCPSNLSATFEAKRRHTDSWSSPRMFTQNDPACAIRGQVLELLSGKKATSGGSRETLVNEPTTMPAGGPSGGVAVTTHTPVGYWPSTCRNHCLSVALDPSTCTFIALLLAGMAVGTFDASAAVALATGPGWYHRALVRRAPSWR